MNREMMATIVTCGMWCGVASAAVDASLAERLNAMVSTDRLRITHMELASEPHVAGTPGDERTIRRLITLFEEAGLETTRHDIWPLLARPVRAEVSIVSPMPRSLAVQENAVDGDVDSRTSDVGWNAYSGSGVAEGPVVYVNYGTKQDFERLASLGVSCEGKIVLARYGGNYRGYKVKFAQQAGAIGLIIFTDPADGGHVSGPVYPIGGYANECHIQRGSVVTMPFQGDPLTPGREATEDAVRDRVEDAPLPRIPSQPIGYGAAREILAAMRGVAAPKEWQGGLGFEYRLESDGGGEAGVRVRVEVKQERAVMRTANVIGEIRGTEFPDERVIIGAHHDAWNHGASDPLSGTIAVIEAARVFGALAMEGIKPRRTLVFAAWGAEEFGIIGSSEWVEGNERMLVEGGVAYINLDMASMGPKFGASATPSMHGVILAAAGLVPQSGAAESTVLEDWTGRTAPRPGLGRRPAIGNIGGGSDHVAFIARAGVCRVRKRWERGSVVSLGLRHVAVVLEGGGGGLRASGDGDEDGDDDGGGVCLRGRAADDAGRVRAGGHGNVGGGDEGGDGGGAGRVAAGAAEGGDGGACLRGAGCGHGDERGGRDGDGPGVAATRGRA
jgi:N-acetylated-alpha-linked acidic dipeptidase